MKKILFVLLTVLLCFSFASCFEADEPVKEQSAQGSNTGGTEKTEEIFALNEAAVFKNLKFTATEIVESEGTDFFTPESGNIFVGIKFTVENISNEEQSVSSILMFEGYADDVKCEYSFNAACAFDDGTLDGTIAPGKKLVGWYALEVSRSWKVIELQIEPTWLSSNSAKFVFEK